jgi:hypothetical protein
VIHQGHSQTARASMTRDNNSRRQKNLLERAYHEIISDRIRGRAAESTIEALMLFAAVPMDKPNLTESRLAGNVADWPSLRATSATLLRPLVAEHCETCGGTPCINPMFCQACRAADAKRRGLPEDRRLKFLRRLMADDISLERVWRELNDPRAYPTPQATIEAVMWCVRERGIAALQESANVERLSRCDTRAKTEINNRIAALQKERVTP